MAGTKKARPLIPSSIGLRAIATAVTITSFTGMSAFAASHLQNASAPLQPAAGTATATATPAPTSATRRTTLGSGITTTTTPALTRTRRS